jgi:hypothetical protein
VDRPDGRPSDASTPSKSHSWQSGLGGDGGGARPGASLPCPPATESRQKYSRKYSMGCSVGRSVGNIKNIRREVCV